GDMAGTNIYAMLDKIGGTQSSLREGFIDTLANAYESEYDILEELHDYTHAITIQRKILHLFDKGLIAQNSHNLLKQLVYQEMLMSLFLASDYQGFLAAEKDTWYHAVLDTSKSATAFNDNLKGLVYLNEGEYGNAYKSFLHCYEISKDDDDPSAAGNLALYYSVIKDTTASYNFSLEAVDKALRSNVNEALNLFHLAKAGAGKLSEDEQLDYMIRAVRHARGNINGEEIIMILDAAAGIALNNTQPDLALKLLDQAIEFTTTEDWQQMGPSVLLLYSQCLEQLHITAVPILNTAVKLAQGLSRDDYITGCYMLSKYYIKKNNLDSALYYSTQAFDSVGSYRKTIYELSQKSAFLTDKQEVANLHIKLLQLTHKPVQQIFDAIESWKMQSFIDVYKDRGIYKNLENSKLHRLLSDSLASVLSPADMLIDFSINEDHPFSITMDQEGQLKMFPVAKTSQEVKSLVERIRNEMDVNNLGALEMIRKDKISASLQNDLTELYRALFSPVLIPPGIHRMLIVPDETLYGVPWSALKLPGTEDYFMDHYEYSIFPSAAIAFAICRNIPPVGGYSGLKALIMASLSRVDHPALVKAIPSLTSSSPSMFLERLVNGKGEAESIAHALEKQNMNIKFLLDDKTKQDFSADRSQLAIRSNFLRDIRDVSVLHCISHGIFNKHDPMLSCLFIEPDETGNRLITPQDLIDSNLTKLSLVSLSACQTGINSLLPGSEPIGFLRSFLGAGTAHILLTDWEIDDKTTAELFTDFYTRLNSGKISWALNEARRTIREKHHHPFFWSGIALYGNPN
ncbi:MAG TPA: CHAT domain-containing protein, partial [Puia sp.]|nr:CHAT domain-containing protein [Puia sp.]